MTNREKNLKSRNEAWSIIFEMNENIKLQEELRKILTHKQYKIFILFTQRIGIKEIASKLNMCKCLVSKIIHRAFDRLEKADSDLIKKVI